MPDDLEQANPEGYRHATMINMNIRCWNSLREGRTYIFNNMAVVTDEEKCSRVE